MTEIYKILNLIAIIQGIFLGLILIFNKKNKYSNRILAVLLFVIAFSMLRWHFQYIEFFAAYYYMVYINIPFYLLVGPLVYLYTRSITGTLTQFSGRIFYHFIPFVLFFSFMIFKYHIIDGARNIEDLKRISNSSFLGLEFFAFIFLILIMIYILLSFHLLKKYNKNLKDMFSDIEKLRLLWLNLFLTLAIVFCLILIIAGVLIVKKLILSSMGYVAGLAIYSIFLISNFAVTYFSIKYPEVFTQEVLISSKKPYRSFNIDETQGDEYKKIIIKSMEEDKPYLNDSLTLKDFSEMIDLPSHIVSMTLNVHVNQNFYNFINMYRVEEVKRMFCEKDYKDFTILRIAFEAGFNSKTTFNTMFKKFTGNTPSQFRKNSSS